MSLKPVIPTDPPALREVSLKVAAVNGINLGQGVCRMPVPALVLEAAERAIKDGHNLYAPAQGVEELRVAVADKLQSFNKASYPPEQVAITVGSTGAFEAVCHAYLKPGDEVVSFRPHYPYHHNALTLSGATIRYVDLQRPDWRYDSNQLKSAFSKQTKFILLNSPNNPTGKIFTRTELEQIAELCLANDVVCVTDDVYEYITYDGATHTSMAALPEMREHCITMGSYSKTFAITGWRVGYLAAPSALFPALRVAADRLCVCAPTPLQHAVAAGIRELGPDYYVWLQREYTRKRELCRKALTDAGLEVSDPQGAYYMIADISKKFPGRTADSLVDDMISKTKVGAVPASDFVGNAAKTDPTIGNFFRFCFAVPDELLVAAGAGLKGW
jgi:aminotransferase